MSWKKTGVILLITAVFTRMLPFSSFFQNVNTLFHELAHALTALVLNGKVMHIYLFADQSGVTYTSFTDSWVRLPIGLAGYIGASCFAVLLFMVYRSGQQRLGLKLIVAVTASSLVLFVRNDYGIFWCLGFTLLTTLLLLVRKSWLDKGYFLLIAFICLVESFISSVVLLMLAISGANRSRGCDWVGSIYRNTCTFLGDPFRLIFKLVRKAGIKSASSSLWTS